VTQASVGQNLFREGDVPEVFVHLQHGVEKKGLVTEKLNLIGLTGKEGTTVKVEGRGSRNRS